MKEYIIHGTTVKNLEDILNSKYIEANINKKNKGMLQDNSVNQIFTQLLYRNLPNENIQIPYWFDCAIILDKKILKDYPFYATITGGFLNNFNDAFIKNPKQNIYAKGKGNLQRIPNLKNLKNNIENTMKKYIILKSVQFMHSHEILFNKKIILDMRGSRLDLTSSRSIFSICTHLKEIFQDKNIPRFYSPQEIPSIISKFEINYNLSDLASSLLFNDNQQYIERIIKLVEAEN